MRRGPAGFAGAPRHVGPVFRFGGTAGARFLKLEKGAVTPLGVLNDEERAVEVLFEAGLTEKPVLGVHPGDNRATVFLAFADLEALIRAHGNRVSFVRL